MSNHALDAVSTVRARPHVRSRRGHSTAALSIAAAFVLLIGVVLVGSILIDRGSTRTERAVLLNSAYQHAASGVAAEESLERKYRLEPGPVPLTAHTDAEQQVTNALAEVRQLGGAQDQQLVRKVSAEHARYVIASADMFAAVDRHAPVAAVNAIDTKRVDPVFDVMQTEIYAAAAHHETDALQQVASSRHAGWVVIALDIATLLLGLGAILAGGIALSRSQRRLRRQRDNNLHLAHHDSLTGLPNRALFQDRTEQALLAAKRSGGQVAVMFADLDRFKDVNDTLGHHYGDLLLAQVAMRFTATLRAEDSVARLGGDEFAILLSSASREDAVQAAVRLTEALREPFNIKDILLDVEVSIGIALAGPGADVDAVLRHADVAMYEAKSQRVPFAVYELQRDDNTLDRLALLGDLRRGITRGELILHYQPKVNARSGELHSVEALVRWRHPTRGLLAPDTFIPIAESTAVIHHLTDEVLSQALAQARTWLDDGRTIPIAVNISARSLHDLDFPDTVQRHLDTAGVPGTMLSLELTESSIMTDPDRALIVLTALAAKGIALSIDDFGTGYSSMSYLKRLPVRELKIDRSFVKGLVTEPGDVVMVQSALDLGHNLGLHVVAEGVEDAATQDMLAAMGCDQVQGYYISRPVPVEQFDLWLNRTHPRAASRQVGTPS